MGKAADVEIRDFRDADYPGLQEVYNATYPEHRESLEEMKHWDETWDHTRYERRRYVAETADGEIVAFGEWGHSPAVFHPRKFWIEVDVHPSQRRRGIGTRLWNHAVRALDEFDPLQLRANARETSPESIRFLERRGFVEVMRTWESVLDLTAFDPSPFGRYFEGLEDIEFTTLAAEEGSRPDLHEALYEQETSLMSDVPLPGPYTPISFEMFEGWFDDPGSLPDGYFLAKEGGDYVGKCVLVAQMESEGELTHGLTGVAKTHRGRGLAMALKVTALQWAKEQGYTRVRTWNDSMNVGILAINEKLGFQREPAWITYVKELGGSDDA